VATNASTKPGNAAGDAARTYIIGGRYMVRCQQHGTAAPRPGFTPIDPDGVLWTR
jgi:hypothetical protein